MDGTENTVMLAGVAGRHIWLRNINISYLLLVLFSLPLSLGMLLPCAHPNHSIVELMAVFGLTLLLATPYWLAVKALKARDLRRDITALRLNQGLMVVMAGVCGWGAYTDYQDKYGFYVVLWLLLCIPAMMNSAMLAPD